MHWISILFIGIAANLDNLGIGVSFGMRSTKIPFNSNMIIAAISMGAAYLSMNLGGWVAAYISQSTAKWSGGIIICLIGLWSIAVDFKTNNKTPAKSNDPTFRTIIHDPTVADLDHNHVISWKESLTLGLALALNCMASGFGAGISGISPIWLSLTVGVFSLITVDLGLRVGYQFASTWFGKYSNSFAGILLILIGIYEVIG